MEKIRPFSQIYADPSLPSSSSQVTRPRPDPAVENLGVLVQRHHAQEISPERFLGEIFTRKKGELGLPKEAAARFLNFENVLRKEGRREELEQLRKECEDFLQKPRNRMLTKQEQELEYEFRKEFVHAIRILQARNSVQEVMTRNVRQPYQACKEYLELEIEANREGRHDTFSGALNEELKKMDPRFRQEFIQAFRTERSKAALDYIFGENRMRPERALERYFDLEERYRRQGGPREAENLRNMCKDRIDLLRGIPMNRFPEVFDNAFANERETQPVQRSSHIRELLRQRREEIEREIASAKRPQVLEENE